MKKSLKVLMAVAIAGVALSQTAKADTTLPTKQFQVMLKVLPSCKFDQTIQNITFQDRQVGDQNVEATTTVRLNCSKGTTATVKFTSTNGKKLKSDNGEIDYALFDGQIDLFNANGVSYPGTGQQKDITVTAKVPNVGQNSGTFSDTVTVAVSF